MSQITVNERVYTLYKTYEAELGVILCFIELKDSGQTYTMMLTPEGEWKFTGTASEELIHNEGHISEAIQELTGSYQICYS